MRIIVSSKLYGLTKEYGLLICTVTNISWYLLSPLTPKDNQGLVSSKICYGFTTIQINSKLAQFLNLPIRPVD